jgi:glycosyltransferase involved in cell wall biosynthesis
MNGTKLSVIMPVLNEEQAIDGSASNVLAGFRRFALNGELVIVNDGSSDRTGEIAEELAVKHDCLKVVHHNSNEGIGAAFRSGVKAATGELVVYIPGDGENDAAEIFRYVSLLETVDIVIPYVTNTHLRPWHRRFISSLYHFMMTRTFSVPVKYLNGTVIYRRAILEGISFRSNGFFYQAELLIKVLRRRYLYAEVPCLLQKKRVAGRSKSVSFASLLTVASGYLGMVWENFCSRREPQSISPGSVTAKMRERLPGFVPFNG